MKEENVRYCLQCDNGTSLEHCKKDVAVVISDASCVVPDVSGWHCPVCGEIEFDEGQASRYMAALKAVIKEDLKLPTSSKVPNAMTCRAMDEADAIIRARRTRRSGDDD